MDSNTMIKKDVEFSSESFLYMKMLANRCGIDLEEYKKESIYNRLIKRIRHLELPDFDAYCYRLRMDIEEESKFINLITNSTTHFFRENHHLDYLAKNILPDLMARKNKIRIWSAGCSTGEEPYSIAIVVREAMAAVPHFDIKILATDVNSDALIDAEKGIYEIDCFQKMSAMRRSQWFREAGVNEHGVRLMQADKSLKELITFNQLNFMDTWPMHGPFDVIFCRNVLIYFKKETCQKILGKFHDLLDMNGVLFLGYSENLNEQRKYYMPVGQTTYKKIS